MAMGVQCPDDLVSATHAVRRVAEVVEHLDVSGFCAPIKAREGVSGRDATDPKQGSAEVSLNSAALGPDLIDNRRRLTEQVCATSLNLTGSACPAFVGFNVLAQYRVNRRLITAAVFSEECQNVGVETNGDLFLGPRPTDGLSEELGTQFRDVGIIDVFVLHRINPRPVSPGSLFRTLHAHLGPPFAKR